MNSRWQRRKENWLGVRNYYLKSERFSARRQWLTTGIKAISAMR
jgi:hypothetical protein